VGTIEIYAGLLHNHARTIKIYDYADFWRNHAGTIKIYADRLCDHAGPSQYMQIFCATMQEP
jgi:hypothetical protein